MRKTVPSLTKPVGTKSKSQFGGISTADRAQKVLALLKKEYPRAKAALNYDTPFELLIATILSAQCTDARVNMVTPGLFRKFPTPKHFAEADIREVQHEIKSIGFYRQKAKSIVSSSNAIMEQFGGDVPRTMAQLLTLAGVGRKTANVVLGNAFGIPGIAVDTHVRRLAQRLGFSEENDPAKIEIDLMKMFPREEWTLLCHLLMSHGRKVCIARLPRCEVCVVNKLCPSAFSFRQRKEKHLED